MPLDAPEVWMRNPRNYIKECVEVGVQRYVWDWSVLHKSRIDPQKFMDLWLGTAPWEAMVIHDQSATLIDSRHSESNPAAVFPVWRYGQSIEVLEDLVANPWGEREALCDSRKIEQGYRPIKGQEHRVILVDLPPMNEKASQTALHIFNEIQGDYPECIMHLHGLYSMRAMFGLDFRSADCDPRTSAQKGKVYLPIGKEVVYETTLEAPHWVHLLGMRPVELRIPRNRCIFNIKSMFWAREHFQDVDKFETKNKAHATDPDDPDAGLPTSQSIFVRRIKPSRGDKNLCNTCTLQLACKYFRDGGVCIVPGSEPLELARFFKTRDSGEIIEGLGTLMAAGARRLDKALEKEEEKDELLPETTKIIKLLFDQGVKLAKLVDPALAASGSARLELVMGDKNTQINGATPQALMAAILDEFMRRGIPREQVTEEMIMAVYASPEDLKQKAIEAASQAIIK